MRCLLSGLTARLPSIDLLGFVGHLTGYVYIAESLFYVGDFLCGHLVLGSD